MGTNRIAIGEVLEDMCKCSNANWELWVGTGEQANREPRRLVGIDEQANGEPGFLVGIDPTSNGHAHMVAGNDQTTKPPKIAVGSQCRRSKCRCSHQSGHRRRSQSRATADVLGFWRGNLTEPDAPIAQTRQKKGAHCPCRRTERRLLGNKEFRACQIAPVATGDRLA